MSEVLHSATDAWQLHGAIHILAAEGGTIICDRNRAKRQAARRADR